MNIEHVIVPTDFSEASVNAMRFGAAIARKKEAKISLLHVYERPYVQTAYNGGLSATVDSVWANEIRKEAIKDLRNLAKDESLSGLDPKAILVADKPTWEFHEDIKGDANLVVMGTTGMTGVIHGGLFGTNTERTIRYSPFPVLSVPKECKFEKIDRILFATDFKGEFHQAVDTLVNLAKIFDAEIQVGLINTSDTYLSNREAMKSFDELSEEVKYEKMQLVIYNAEDVAEGIREFSEERDVDLIAMVTHGRTGMSHFFKGSLTEDVSATIRTPLLAMKYDVQ